MKTSSRHSKVKTGARPDPIDQQDPDDQPEVQPPTRPGPDPQGNPIQLDDGDDGEEVPVARMPPTNLGNDDLDDEDPDNDDDDDLLTSTEDSSDQSEADSMEDEEAEQNEDGDDPIKTAEKEERNHF
jgi:hypothetical protein